MDEETVILRKSRDLVFRDIDDDLLRKFLGFSNREARGNKLYALRILLYNTKDSLIKRLEEVEAHLKENLNEDEEEHKRNIPKTYGGKRDE